MPALLTLCSLASTPCWAADPAPASGSTPQVEDLRRAALERGRPAPFGGVLLTTQALARLLTDADRREGGLRLELATAKAEADARLRAARATGEAELTAARAETRALERDLERQRRLYEDALARAARPTPWFRHPALSFAGGVLLSGGLCVAAWKYMRVPE